MIDRSWTAVLTLTQDDRAESRMRLNRDDRFEWFYWHGSEAPALTSRCADLDGDTTGRETCGTGFAWFRCARTQPGSKNDTYRYTFTFYAVHDAEWGSQVGEPCGS